MACIACALTVSNSPIQAQKATPRPRNTETTTASPSPTMLPTPTPPFETALPPTPLPTTTPRPTPLPAPVGRAGTPIQLGETVSNALTLPGAVERYAFFGKFDDVITLGVFAQAGAGFIPSVQLFAPDGSLIVDSSAPQDLLISAIKLPSSGLYILAIRAGRPNGIGNFTLSLGSGGQLRELEGEVLHPNKPYRGTLLRPGDRQVWTFETRAGGSFRVLAQPAGVSAVDPVITVIAPSGQTVAVAHDLSPANSALTGVIVVSVGGVYQVMITDFTNKGAGDYDLILQPISATPSPAVRVTFAPLDIQLQSSVGQGARYTTFFTGAQGQSVLITVKATDSKTFDPLVELYGPSGRRVAAADDDPGGTDASVRVTLDDGNGVYMVKVGGYALLPGEFTLTIRSP